MAFQTGNEEFNMSIYPILHTILNEGRQHVVMEGLRQKQGLTGEKGDYKFKPSMMKAIAIEAGWRIDQIKIVDIQENVLILDIPCTFKRWRIWLTPKRYNVEKYSLFTLDEGA